MRRRPFVTIAAALLVLTLATAGWALWRASQVRSELTGVQRLVHTVQSDVRKGRIDHARSVLATVQARLDRADSRVHGPIWAAAQYLPVLGRNLHGVARAAEAGKLLGDGALPGLLDAFDTVRLHHPLKNSTVDLAQLAQIAQDVRQATTAAARAKAVLAPSDEPLLASVRANLKQVRRTVADLEGRLQSVTQALDVARTMLGADGARTYLLVLQNNAEARATGGLIGAFAVVRVDHGTISLARTGSDAEFRQSDVPVVRLPGAAATWQAIGSTRAWYDANLTPHFPDAAASVAGLWRAQGGTQVDGVLGVDPVAMRELLAGARPIPLPTGAPVTADNIVDFVGHREYVDYPDYVRRKALLGDLTGQMFHQVLAAKDPVGTLKAALRAGQSGHLLMWSRHPAEQALLAGGPLGGALPADDTPYLSVLTQNFGGNKLDYYLQRAVTVTRARPGVLRVRVVLTNTAPLGLPLYMTVRSDKPKPPVPYGQAKVGFAVYAGRDSVFTEATVDGRPVVLEQDSDHGHALGTTSLELPRDAPVTIDLLVSERAGLLTYRQQPLLFPDRLRIVPPHRVVGR